MENIKDIRELKNLKLKYKDLGFLKILRVSIFEYDIFENEPYGYFEIIGVNNDKKILYSLKLNYGKYESGLNCPTLKEWTETIIPILENESFVYSENYNLNSEYMVTIEDEEFETETIRAVDLIKKYLK